MFVKVTNLCKNYEKFQLSNVSFSLDKGMITGFIGRNGAGKTTTIKSMLGFIHPDQGNISIFGLDYAKNELNIKQRIGYVSGGFNFYPNKKIKDITNVTKSFYTSWDDNLYQFYLDKFHLDENKTPAKLSEGMKVKYSITLALSHHAELLILDEPTSGLDPVSRDELLDIFLELQEQGVTIFFSTHITSDLDKCADNIIYIQNGRIHTIAKREELMSTYRYVHLTNEQMNLVPNTKLIGLKKTKDGYCGIIKHEDTAHINNLIQPADLESIIIHLEKEGDTWEN